MITSTQARDASDLTRQNLSYISTLINDASNSGKEYIIVDGKYMDNNMVKDLRENYNYKVVQRFFDMGTYPEYKIDWITEDIVAYFPNYILEYDFANLSSYSGSGTAVVDLVGNSNGTLHNGPTYNSQYGGTISFNSTSSQYLIHNDNLASKFPGTAPNKSTAFSVVLSMNASNNGIILGETSLSGWHNSILELVGGVVKYSLWDTGLKTVSSSVSFPLNDWNHLVATYDGTTMKLYVNGQLAGSRAITRTEPYNDQPTPHAIYYQIGQGDITNAGDGTYGDFTLSRFELLDGALSSSEVGSKYQFHKDRFGL
jgi:hypothetical protein